MCSPSCMRLSHLLRSLHRGSRSASGVHGSLGLAVFSVLLLSVVSAESDELPGPTRGVWTLHRLQREPPVPLCGPLQISKDAQDPGLRAFHFLPLAGTAHGSLWGKLRHSGCPEMPVL